MRSSKENVLLYVELCAVLVPVILLRDFTPANELRYLSIADEALRNHSFFAFSNHGVPYADKPPLYLWLLMLCRRLVGGHSMWLLALLSLLPAWGIVRTMDSWTRREMDADSRSLARLMLLTCGLFVGMAVTLRMDMLMSFFIVLALRVFWQMQKGEGNSRKNRWLFPLCLFLAVFTKGPIELLIPLCGTTVFLVVRRRIGEFCRYWGGFTWAVLLAGCALWFGAVYLEGGGGYLCDMLLRQTAGRAIHSFHHAEPFYYYAVSIWYCFTPWSLLVVGTVVVALRPKFVRNDLQTFFLAVGITTIVLLSCISSKLQVYLLPAIPFLIYATAMFLPRFSENGWLRLALAVPLVIFAMALPVLLVLTGVQTVPFLHDRLFYIAATILTFSGVHSLYLIYGRRKTVALAIVMRRLAAGLLISLSVGVWTLPRLNVYIGYAEVCRCVLALSQERKIREVLTWHVSRSENMDVYLHFPVTVVEGDKVPAPAGKSCLLLTRRRYLDSFQGKETYVIGPYAVVVLKN